MSQEVTNAPEPEVEPLSDEALEEVSGGATGNVCSISGCSGGNP